MVARLMWLAEFTRCKCVWCPGSKDRTPVQKLVVVRVLLDGDGEGREEEGRSEEFAGIFTMALVINKGEGMCGGRGH